MGEDSPATESDAIFLPRGQLLSPERVLNGEYCANSNFDASILLTTEIRPLRPLLCQTLSRLVDHSSTQAGLRFCVSTPRVSPSSIRSTFVSSFTNPTFL